MMHTHLRESCRWIVVLAVAVILSLIAGSAGAQEEESAPPIQADTTGTMPGNKFINGIAGEFTPARGFDLFRSQRISLNVSFYGMFRSLTQLPANQTFTDHLGRVRPVAAKNDVNWHRTFVWFSGFAFDPKLSYTITLWSLPTTINTILFGKLQYHFSPAFSLAMGIGPNVTNRSLQGSFPFWAGGDRQMMEDALRGGFASGFWATGEPLKRFHYTASVNRSIAQIGVPAPKDNRNFSYSGSVWWMPTTGEFGPRGGLGDLEYHTQLATRFGMSACTAREGRYSPVDQAPAATQIKLADGLNPFETGALADLVTVRNLTYRNVSADAGFKYRGFSFQSEYTIRKLSDFDATGPVPESSLLDQGFFIQGMHMVWPKRLGVYAMGSYIMDEWHRYPYEIAGGANFYPYGNRSFRLNLYVTHVTKCPASSDFGYYVAGQTGTTISIMADILL